MENVYPPENYSSSIHFPLKRYFNEFNLSDVPVFRSDNDPSEIEYLLAIKSLMGINVELNDLTYLNLLCSPESLTCEQENTKDFPIEVPENINSSSKLPMDFISNKRSHLEVNKCKIELEKKKSAFHLALGNKRKHHKRLEFTVPSMPPDLQPGSDFVVSILIYQPFAFNYFNAKNTSEKLRFSHEIVALGQNTLSELRDKIICTSDDGLCKEVQSTSDDLKSLADAKGKYPSGFLFIDDIFYNDFRSLKAVDYSLPIMEWSKEKKIKGLQSKSMENVSLDTLTPRFGYPYLFMHQGDCEHILVFADAKLLDTEDCLHSQCYPHVIKLNRKGNKMCLMCTVSFAKWICIDSDRLPQNKVFLCTECCNAYNYNDGQKIGNFKLYPYYEKHVMT